MSLWGSLYVGNSGLSTSHNALNTVAHNLTNVDTKGYTRQQVEQSDKRYITLSKSASSVSYQQTGLGVLYSNVKQIRDYFLDKTYRRESGRSMFYEISSGVLEEVEDQLGEMQGQAFQKTLRDTWTAVQELTKDPCSSVTQGTLVQEAQELLGRAKAVYQGLSDYQDNLNIQVKQQVEKINDLGLKIHDLNDRIRVIEVGGTESANDLRDTRNYYIDELSKLANISYDEDQWGNVAIQIEGEDFVKGSTVYLMGLDIDSRNGFYTPFWPQNASTKLGSDEFPNGNTMLVTVDGKQMGTGVFAGQTKTFDLSNAKVFNLDRKISSDLNTDIGGLKAMLLARGDHRADYTDIENNYDNVSDSILMNMQAEFDQMMHNLITAVNGVLEDAAGVKSLNEEELVDKRDDGFYNGFVDGEGKKVYLGNENGAILLNEGSKIYCVEDNSGYMTDTDGSPLMLFNKATTDSYIKAQGSDGKNYWVFVNEITDSEIEKESLYSITNTAINQSLLQKPTMLKFRLPDGSEDTKTMDALKSVFTDERYYLNPNVKKPVNLIDYYDDLVSQVSNSAFVYDTIYENQQTTVEATESARDQVTAVSSDEELSNMIKFQSAYNASSRFINVVNSMIEHLLNSLT